MTANVIKSGKIFYMDRSLGIWIDTDNALGSFSGDIDDAFAIAALAAAQRKILGISSIFGNTSERNSHQNCKAFCKILNLKTSLFRGATSMWKPKSQASDAMANQDEGFRLLAIGPLTNLASALKQNSQLPETLHETVLIGTNLDLALPLSRFTDFNVWMDPWAAHRVFRSKLNVTIIPCNVARRLKLSAEHIAAQKNAPMRYLFKHSKRWFLRSKLFKGVNSVPLWDATAALYLLYPELFVTELRTPVTSLLRGFGWSKKPGHHLKRVVTDFNVEAVREKLFSLLSIFSHSEFNETIHR